MKQLLVLLLLIIVALFAWGLASNLSSDALGMAVGMIFGILSGIPAALLVLAASRRRPAGSDGDDDGDDWQRPQPGQPYGQNCFAPPVIVVTGSQGAQAQQYPGQYAQPQLPGQARQLPGPPAQHSERVFKVVGEKEEWLDEW